MAITTKSASAALKRPGRFLYVTHGTETVFQIEGEGVVTRKTANALTGDLFATAGMMLPTYGRNGKTVEPDVVLVGAEDGLFPGMSQTYWPEES